jgi:hypothetical protein
VPATVVESPKPVAARLHYTKSAGSKPRVDADNTQGTRIDVADVSPYGGNTLSPWGAKLRPSDRNHAFAGMTEFLHPTDPDAVGLDSSAAVPYQRPAPSGRHRRLAAAPSRELELTVLEERDDHVDPDTTDGPQVIGLPQPVSSTSSLATSWR